jgi:hypothetical protein
MDSTARRPACPKRRNEKKKGKGKNTEEALKDGMIKGISTENVQIFYDLGQACKTLLATA